MSPAPVRLKIGTEIGRPHVAVFGKINPTTVGTQFVIKCLISNVNTETLRYYEREGLLPEPERTEAGYRLYTDEDVKRVRFIKRAQELGFSLKEVKELPSA